MRRSRYPRIVVERKLERAEGNEAVRATSPATPMRRGFCTLHYLKSQTRHIAGPFGVAIYGATAGDSLVEGRSGRRHDAGDNRHKA